MLDCHTVDACADWKAFESFASCVYKLGKGTSTPLTCPKISGYTPIFCGGSD